MFQRKQPDRINHLNELGNGGNGKAPMIQLRKLVKTYTSAAGEFPVLKEIDANIYEGEFVGVIGRSGSGKSTLLNMIAGIDRPTSGEIQVGDMPVHELSESELAVWRGRNMGVVSVKRVLWSCCAWWSCKSTPGNCPQPFPGASSNASPSPGP
jgi:ABC-type glutathione transport system ATPase component